MAIFSIPINTKLSEEFVEGTFIPFLKEYKHLIYDMYFTCRMPPFTQDAMGDTIEGDIRETTFNENRVLQLWHDVAWYVSLLMSFPLLYLYSKPCSNYT